MESVNKTNMHWINTNVQLAMTVKLRLLADGKQTIELERMNRGGVITTRTWNVTAGHPVTPVIQDVMAAVGKTFVDEFSYWGAV